MVIYPIETYEGFLDLFGIDIKEAIVFLFF